MQSVKRVLSLLVSVGALGIGASAQAAPVAAFNATGVNRPGDAQGPFAFSEDFNVGATPIVVTALGFYDDGADGLTEAHNVALYDRSNTTTALASVPVPTGATAPIDGVGTYSNGSGRQGGFRFVTLTTPITLPPNFQGSVVGYLISDTPGKTDNYGDGGQGFNDGSSINGGTALITYAGNAFNPTTATSGYFHQNGVGGSGLAGASFQYDVAVPEPVGLSALAVVGLGLLARRRRMV